MPKVEIYTSPHCSYCVNAKGLLSSRNIAFKEFDISRSQSLLSEMLTRTGGRTFPQIIINGDPIGGYEDLLKVDLTKLQ
jgi:GrxC family glutaredoxin